MLSNTIWYGYHLKILCLLDERHLRLSCILAQLHPLIGLFELLIELPY